MQQRDECRSKNKEAHNFAVACNQCVALQEQFADGERSRNDLAIEEDPAASVEDRIDGVVGGTIGTKTQRWRRINWIDGGARAKGAPGDNGRCQRRGDRDVQAHSWPQLQEARDDGQTLLFHCGHRAKRASHAVDHAGIRLEDGIA